MITGALVGWKGSKPEIIEAGDKLGSMTAKFRELNTAIADGKGKFDKVEFFKNAFKTAKAKNTGKAKKELL